MRRIAGLFLLPTVVFIAINGCGLSPGVGAAGHRAAAILILRDRGLYATGVFK